MKLTSFENIKIKNIINNIIRREFYLCKKLMQWHRTA